MVGSDDLVARAERANAAARPVTIDGGVVTRTAHPGSATVFAYLDHLRAQGLDCVPEPLGLDGGVERLRYLDGDSGGDGWRHQHADDGLASAARLLRTVHDAGAGWRPPADAVWGAPALDPQEVFCHGDPGPWNMVWRDGVAVGLIDWDFLHPAPRADDVAYALRWFAPLRSDTLARGWHHCPAVPDRRRRVERFLAAYGELPPFDLVDAVIARIERVVDHVRARAEAGVEPQRSWVADGVLQLELADIHWLEEHRPLFAAG